MQRSELVCCSASMANQEPSKQANQTERDIRNNSNSNLNKNDDTDPEGGRRAQGDEVNRKNDEQAQSRVSEDVQQQQQVLRPRQIASQRPGSFAPPFPVPVGGMQSTPVSQPLLLTPASIVGTPLTNHEIYELIQRHQQQQQASLRASQPSVLSGGGSFKRSKRQSLYGLAGSINRGTSGSKLERQSSIIVGTASFQERYGKLFEQH